MHDYRPQVCEGYVFTPLCQSFCSQEGVCPIVCWDTPQVQRQAPPGPKACSPGPEAGIPRTRGRHPPRSRPPGPEAGTLLTRGRHPLWEQTPPRNRPPPRTRGKYPLVPQTRDRHTPPPPRSRSPPPPPLTQCMLVDTGNKRAVRILLECNLGMQSKIFVNNLWIFLMKVGCVVYQTKCQNVINFLEMILT